MLVKNPIPDSCQVEYTMDGGSVQVRMERDGSVLHIKADGPLLLEATASNWILIGVKGD